MARRFTRASSDAMAWDGSTGGIGTSFPYGTIIARVRRGANQGNYQAIIELTDGSANSPFAFGFTTANTCWVYGANGALERDSTTTVTSQTDWTVAAVTKDTGNVTPRFHFFKGNNAWTHEAGSGVMLDWAAITGVNVGFDLAGDYLDADVAAVMALNSRVMTDSEIERSVQGSSWDQWVGPHDFLAEFKSGRDPYIVGTVARHPDQSRARIRQTATATISGTIRTQASDPPGHKFSRLTRRR